MKARWAPQARGGFGLGLVLPGLLVLAACGSLPPMRPAEDIGAEPLALAVVHQPRKGLLVNEAFNMGPYQISQVQRRPTRTRTTASGDERHEYTEGGFSFQMAASDGVWAGRCQQLSEVHSDVKTDWLSLLWRNHRSLDPGTFSVPRDARHVFECECSLGDQHAWLQTFRGLDRSDQYWVLNVGASQYTTTPPGSMKEQAMQGLMQHWRSEQGTVASQSLVTGQVWLSGRLSADEQAPLACLMSAQVLNGHGMH